MDDAAEDEARVRAAVELAADTLLMFGVTEQVHPDNGWFVSFEQAYGPVFVRAGGAVAEVAAAVVLPYEPDEREIEMCTAVGRAACDTVEAEARVLLHGAVYLAAVLLEQLAAVTGRPSADLIRESVERLG